jgi:predicted O-methyltransferase YrrM
MKTDAEIYDYAEAFTTAESPVLKKLNRDTHVNILYPRMLSGKLQGTLLKMISNMVSPELILEIGTFTGYSAICLAEGLTANGILHTIEINPELEDMELKYFEEAGVKEKIKLHIGNAIEIIPTLNEKFDIVFIDADKENYLNYYNLIFDKVRKGGFILADNVLWDGKVLDQAAPADTETKSLQEFNQFVQNDIRVENLLLPFRDGISIIRKI